jgi:glycosyltransferase 2 family protein
MDRRKKIIKWLMLAGKLLVVALLIWTIKGTLAKAYDDLRHHEWQLDPKWLVVSGLFYLLGTIPSALFWHQVIGATDHPVRRFDSLRAFYVAQIGKYVPGKAMVLLLRAEMMRGTGVPGTVVTVAVFFETLSNMAVGSFVSLLILLTSDSEHYWMLVLGALGMLLVTGLPTLPPIFKLVLRFSGLGKINPTAVKKLGQIGMRVLAPGWAMMAAGWWLQGLSLWAVLRALGAASANPLEHWPLHTAVSALGVVAGFLALLPAGLGPREWVQIELLSPAYGDTIAVVSAIVLRLVFVVSDASISSILYLARPRRAEPAATVVDEAARANVELPG